MEQLKRRKSRKGMSILIVCLAIVLIGSAALIGAMIAHRDDGDDGDKLLTFNKVELSSGSIRGVNGKLQDVTPGNKIVNGVVSCSKASESEAIYVRAKVAFTLPEEYQDNANMLALVEKLSGATDFNINTNEQSGGAVWSEKKGNYFYLVTKTDNNKMMTVDTTDTYILSNKMVIPRDIEILEVDSQYVELVNFNIAFEAIQADGVSDNLTEAEKEFNKQFPSGDKEKAVYNVTIMNSDDTIKETFQLEEGQIVTEPDVELIDENDETRIFAGWYADKTRATKYKFGHAISEDVVLYPRILPVSTGLAFKELTEPVATSNSPDFRVNNETVVTSYSVAKGTCEDTIVVVPKTYLGKPVVAVTANGFKDATNIEEVFLPDSITKLNNYAFAGCTNMDMDKLPANLQSIGDYAFQNCSKLSLTSLPSGATKIGNYSFYGCSKLALTSLPEEITAIGWGSYQGSTFYGCTSLALTSLPEGLKILQYQVFSGCTSLALTSLPAGLTKIEPCAFVNCENITISSIPEGVKVIGQLAFSGCKKLAITDLSDKLTRIERCAFQECSSITGITIGASTGLDEKVFYNCTSLKTIKYYNTGNFYFDVWDQPFYKAGSEVGGVTLIIGKNVPQVPDYIFNQAHIKEVIFEESSICTKIGESAFSNAYIGSITLPDSVETIGEYAFQGCNGLTTLNIPKNVKTIEQGAFYNCKALTEINFNATNMNDIDEYGYPFSYAGRDAEGITVTIGANVTKVPAYLFRINGADTYANVKEVTFEEGSICTSIGTKAFYFCKAMTTLNFNAVNMSDLKQNVNAFYASGSGGEGIEVTFGKNVTRVPAYLFYSNEYSVGAFPKIKSVTFADDCVCTEIGKYAFNGGKDAIFSSLPSGIVSLGEYSFTGCVNLTLRSLPNGITSIKEAVFRGCTNLLLTSLPSGITSIGKEAFHGCNNIALTSLPTGITEIPESAFAGCWKLALTSLPSGLTTIGKSAFSYCDIMPVIDIPSGVTSIGKEAFYACRSVTTLRFNATNVADFESNNMIFEDIGRNGDGVNVTIGANVKRIPAFLFHPMNSQYESLNIVSITFEEGSECTSIGDCAFYNRACFNATSLPSGIISIGSAAFSGCTNLALTELPSGITSIGNAAFYDCANIKLSELPQGITAIGANTFADCENITLTSLPDGVTSLGMQAFSGCRKLALSSLPSGLTSIGDRTFQSCEKLSTLVIPGGVTNIGQDAFRLCTGLTQITLSEGVETLSQQAFYGCYKLASIILPTSLKSIAKGAFIGCGQLKNVYYTGSQAQFNLINITLTDNTYFTNATKTYNYVIEG